MLARLRAYAAAMPPTHIASLMYYALSWLLLTIQIVCFRLLALDAVTAACWCWSANVLAASWGMRWLADKASSQAYVRGIQELATAHLRAIEGERARAAQPAANVSQAELLHLGHCFGPRDWH